MNNFPVSLSNLMDTIVNDPIFSYHRPGVGPEGNKSTIKLPAPGIGKEDVTAKRAEDYIYIYVKDEIFKTIPIKTSIPTDSISITVTNGIIEVEIDDTKSLEEIKIT